MSTASRRPLRAALRASALLGPVVAAACLLGAASAPADPASAPQAKPRRSAQVHAQPVDAALPSYVRKGEMKGSIRCVGEPATTRLLGLAGDAFRAAQGGVTVDARGESADAGVKALVDGKADIAAIGRRLTARERDALAAKGQVVEVAVAFEALEIVVHGKNPVTSMTMDEVAAVFAAAPKGRAAAATWKDVGATDAAFGAKALTVFGVPADANGGGLVAGTILGGGAFRSDLRKVASSDAVVGGVASEPTGIGYIDPYFRSAPLHAIQLAATAGAAPVACSPATVADGSYPLGRRLTVCFVRPAKDPLPAQVAEFLAFLLTKEGQTAIAEGGGMPLTAGVAGESRSALP